MVFTVSMFQNSVNSRFPTIPYPWLVFGEKVKVNAVLIRDSTGVPDSSLILFGGSLSTGVQVISLIFLFLTLTLVRLWNTPESNGLNVVLFPGGTSKNA